MYCFGVANLLFYKQNPPLWIFYTHLPDTSHTNCAGDMYKLAGRSRPSVVLIWWMMYLRNVSKAFFSTFVSYLARGHHTLWTSFYGLFILFLFRLLKKVSVNNLLRLQRTNIVKQIALNLFIDISISDGLNNYSLVGNTDYAIYHLDE